MNHNEVVETRGHGRTAGINRPVSYGALSDDVAGFRDYRVSADAADGVRLAPIAEMFRLTAATCTEIAAASFGIARGNDQRLFSMQARAGD